MQNVQQLKECTMRTRRRAKRLMTFKTEMKRMEAFKAPRQGGREEEKGLRVECAGMRFEEWKL